MGNMLGVRELRQHLSRYLARVKEGESFTVTERGREVAHLAPSGPPDSPLGRLIAERGATMPTTHLIALDAPEGRPAQGAPSTTLLDELREERL